VVKICDWHKTSKSSYNRCFNHSACRHLLNAYFKVVAANKCDLMAEKEPGSCVDQKAADEFAKSISASLFYTSAKTGDGIGKLFKFLSEELVRAHDTRQAKGRGGLSGSNSGRTPNLLLDAPQEGSSSSCC